MKKLLPLLLIILIPLIGLSQNISVADFYHDVNDQTANSYGTMVYDQNGEICALIRIQTTEKGFAFEVGSIGVTKVDESKVGEIWVYVPKGVRRMTIRHQKLGTLSDYYFPVSIESAKTYAMELVTGTVQTIVKKSANQQFVVFDVTPTSAMIEFDNNVLPVNNGQAEKFVDFGTYNYQVRAPLYHSETGTVTVNDSYNKKYVKVNLKPAFGSVGITGNSASGALVYIDDQYKGTAPITCESIESGTHVLYLAKDKYKGYRQTISVSDGQVTMLTPTLEPNFAHITFKVEPDVEIWINQVKKSTGTISDDFEAGPLLIECRKESHRSTSRTVNVIAGSPEQTITLENPIPITGSISIITNPSRATIYIDGEKVGESPLFLPSSLIGVHKIRFEKEGYAALDTIVIVKEGVSLQCSFKLDNSAIKAKEYSMKGTTFYNSKNYQEAVKWYQKAAVLGDVTAQINLGLCYYNGEGVQQSYEKAAEWYQKAANQGDATAQINLGWCYYKGEGVQQSYKDALKWFQKAVDQGYVGQKVMVERCKNQQ